MTKNKIVFVTFAETPKPTEPTSNDGHEAESSTDWSSVDEKVQNEIDFYIDD